MSPPPLQSGCTLGVRPSTFGNSTASALGAAAAKAAVARVVAARAVEAMEAMGSVAGLVGKAAGGKAEAVAFTA